LKVPICIFDAKTGVLCSKCESRLKNGELSKIDVECSIKLIKLSVKNQDIDKLNLIGSQKIDEDYVLILKDSNVSHINSNDKLISSVEKEFNGKVWFVEANSSIRRFLENLFFPIRILKTNMIWLPDGNQVTQVTIGSKDYEKSFNLIEKIKKIVNVVRNIELVVEISGK
jgi:transcription antitermination factor NusA-like protein